MRGRGDAQAASAEEETEARAGRDAGLAAAAGASARGWRRAVCDAAVGVEGARRPVPRRWRAVVRWSGGALDQQGGAAEQRLKLLSQLGLVECLPRIEGWAVHCAVFATVSSSRRLV